jgi:DNA helicase-2/ATP-dependent DNA helicase PcrA
MKRRVYGEELASEPSQFLNEMPLDLIDDLTRGNSWLSFARGSSEIEYEHGEYRRSAHAATGNSSDRGSSPTVREGAFPSRTPSVREGSQGPADRTSARKDNTTYTGKTYNSVDSIAEFFKQRATQLGNTGGSFESTRERAEREKSDSRPRGGSPPVRKGSSNEPETRNSKLETKPSTSDSRLATPDFTPGSYVKHAKYGRGLVLRREGVGDSLKLTVTFPGYGQKKLVQKYASLEKA